MRLNKPVTQGSMYEPLPVILMKASRTISVGTRTGLYPVVVAPVAVSRISFSRPIVQFANTFPGAWTMSTTCELQWYGNVSTI